MASTSTSTTAGGPARSGTSTTADGPACSSTSTTADGPARYGTSTTAGGPTRRGTSSSTSSGTGSSGVPTICSTQTQGTGARIRQTKTVHAQTLKDGSHLRSIDNCSRHCRSTRHCRAQLRNELRRVTWSTEEDRPELSRGSRQSHPIQGSDPRGSHKDLPLHPQKRVQGPNHLRQFHWGLTTLVICGLLVATTAQHVVFEDIGKFAGATNYYHVALHLELEDLQAPILAYRHIIERTEKTIKGFDVSSYSKEGLKPTFLLKDLIQNHQTAHQVILDQAKVKQTYFQADLDRLKAIFPSPETDATLPLELQGSRNKRFLKIVGSVLGTFLGIFTRAQIRTLEKQMADLQDRTQHLITVTNQHTLQLQEHTNIIHDLASYLTITTLQNPAITLSDLGLIERNITRALEIARNTFQAAQFRRLSIDFLRPEHLEKIFREVQKRAYLEKSTLIPSRPSDLFQLELSYLFDGTKAVFILHVPAVPKGALLRLIRFHSFPLVYQDTAFLPTPENDVLALSDNPELLSLEISYSDLMDCHHSNQFYVCEKHGILRRQLASTCLGALYAQKWDQAMTLCSMEVGYNQEAVLHLTGSKYLVYSPVDITVVKDCAPSAAEDKAKQDFAKIGITEINVPAGCTAELNDHKIIADSSIQIDTDIQHFEWNFNGLSSRITPDDIKQALHDVSHNFQFNHLTLSDLIQNINDKKSNSWVSALAITGTAVAIVAFLGFLFFTSLGYRFRRHIAAVLQTIKEEAKHLRQRAEAAAQPQEEELQENA